MFKYNFVCLICNHLNMIKNKVKLWILLLLITISQFIFAPSIISQDTFSIVAVDTVTGEIGSAGASCVGPISGVGAFIISDVIESVGSHKGAVGFSFIDSHGRQIVSAGVDNLLKVRF